MEELSDRLRKAAASPLLPACALVLSLAWLTALLEIWLPRSLMSSFVRTVMTFFHVKAGVIRYGTWINMGRTLLLLLTLPLPTSLFLLAFRLPKNGEQGKRLFKTGLTVLSVLLTAALLLAEAFLILEMIVALALYKDYTVSLRFLPLFLLFLGIYILWLLYARSLKRVMNGWTRAMREQGPFDCPLFPIILSFAAILPAAFAAASAKFHPAARAAFALLALFFLLWGLWLCVLRTAARKASRKTEEHPNYMRLYKS